jgi:drug/metabolite transporter (DMT)-like permease
MLILSKSNKGLLLAIIANLIWGSAFIVYAKVLKFMQPFTIIFLIFFVTSMVLFIYKIFSKDALKFPKGSGTFFAFVLNAFLIIISMQALMVTGLKWIPSSMSASIMLLSPLMIIFISSLIDLKLEFKDTVGVSAGFIGGLFLVYDSGYSFNLTSNMEIRGIIYTFIASFCLALSTFTTQRLIKNFGVLNTLFWSVLFALPVHGTVMVYENRSNPAILTLVSTPAVFYILYLSVICTAFTFYIWNKALDLSGPKKIENTVHAKTPAAILLGVLIGQEHLSFNYLIGTLLISTGLVFVYFRDDKQKRDT